jgi:AcrR family transcriptional regulator
MSKRMIPADRKASILEAAVTAAQKQTFSGLRLHHIATAADCSNALVVSHFGTMTKMRRAVMRAAIQREILPLIAQGVATGDPTATKANKVLKDKALASLSV